MLVAPGATHKAATASVVPGPPLEAMEAEFRAVPRLSTADYLWARAPDVAKRHAGAARPSVGACVALAALGLALHVAALRVSGAQHPHCSANMALESDCGCEPDTWRISLPFELVLYAPYRVMLSMLALRLTGVMSPWTGLATGVLVACLGFGVNVLLAAVFPDARLTVYVIEIVCVDLGLLYGMHRRARGTPFAGRVEPLALFFCLLLALTVVFGWVMRVLVEASDVALVLVAPLLVSAEFLLLHALRRRCAFQYAAGDLAVVLRVACADLEGLRVGMLLVAARKSTSTFAASLVVAMVVETLARNDLYWSGLRVLVLRWPDARVRARFSDIKSIAVSSRFDSEYVPLVLAAAMAGLGSLGYPIMVDCAGELFGVFRPGWRYVAAIVAGEVATDALAVAMNRLMRRRRPLLARNLVPERPPSHLFALITPMACVTHAMMGVAVVSLMHDASTL